MRRQQYGLKAGFWNVDGFSEEKASDDLLQDEIRKYDILFLGETWQHKYNLNSLHYPLGYFHDFVYKNNLFITVLSFKEEYQSMIRHQKIFFGLR